MQQQGLDVCGKQQEQQQHFQAPTGMLRLEKGVATSLREETPTCFFLNSGL